MSGIPVNISNLQHRVELLERELRHAQQQLQGLARVAAANTPQQVRLVRTHSTSPEGYPASPANTFDIQFLDASLDGAWTPGEATQEFTPRSAGSQAIGSTLSGDHVPRHTRNLAVLLNEHWWLLDQQRASFRWAVADDTYLGSGLEDVYSQGHYRLMNLTEAEKAEAEITATLAYTMSSINVVQGEPALILEDADAGNLAFPLPRNIWQIFTAFTLPTTNGEVSMGAGGSSGHGFATTNPSPGRITFQARGTYDVHIRWSWSQTPGDQSEISIYPYSTANGVQIHLGYPPMALALRTSTHGPGWDHLHTRVTCHGPTSNELGIGFWKHFGSDDITLLEISVFITHVAGSLPFTWAAP